MPDRNATPLPLLPQGRACGACSLCCKALPIPELEKPAAEWCRHIAAHGAGCSIYPDRPPVCRAFRCGWLNGAGPESARPDRAGFILHATDDGTEGLCVTFAAGRELELPPWLRAGIETLIARGVPVYLFVEGRGGMVLEAAGL